MDSPAVLSVFVSAGELSGDLHAARLLKALAEHPAVGGLRVSALGSLNLQALGARILHDTACDSAMGLLSNLAQAPAKLRLFHQVVRHLLQEPPDLVLLVDWRFFNLNLARTLRQSGYRGAIVHYVAPVIWQAAGDERYAQIARQPASFQRKVERRFEMLREFVDLALVIYPVGLELYEHFGVSFEFIGHPLCDEVRPLGSEEELRDLVGAAPGAPLLGLMPGSRREEVALIGRELIRALRIINEQMPEVACALPVAHPDLRPLLLSLLRRSGANLTLLEPPQRYDLMAYADLMVVASGTATHECALAGTPQVMVYRLHPLHDLLYSAFTHFHLPAYAFPNIISGRQIVPELIRGECTAVQIAGTVMSLLEDRAELLRMRRDLAEVRHRICRPNALARACELIVQAVAARIR